MITVNIPVLDIMVFVFGFMAGYLVYVVCDCINERRFKQNKTILEKMEAEISTMQKMKKVMPDKEQTISNLKKLKSFHNGSYGADINRAIKAVEQEGAIEKIRADVEGINPWTLAYAPSKDRDVRPQIVTNVKNHVLEIIDKYTEGVRDK